MAGEIRGEAMPVVPDANTITPLVTMPPGIVKTGLGVTIVNDDAPGTFSDCWLYIGYNGASGDTAVRALGPTLIPGGEMLAYNISQRLSGNGTPDRVYCKTTNANHLMKFVVSDQGNPG